MKERPILFRGEMVRAILDGRKSQTRRVANVRGADRVIYTEHGKLVPPLSGGENFSGFVAEVEALGGKNGLHLPLICPYGQAGDRLWVRETFYYDEMPYAEGGPLPNALWQGDSTTPSKDWTDNLYYRADGECCEQIHECSCAEVGKVKWRPGIHMPRWASRINLEITGTRVERVQDISEADAKAEGVKAHPDVTMNVAANGYTTSFRHTWTVINLKRGFGWDANPWVWVIEFKRVMGNAA